MSGTTYFAYGANIDRDHMASTCPASQCLGRGVLEDSRLLINEDGWATVVSCQDSQVHGALWLLSPACEASLDEQEDIGGGLYRKELAKVRDQDGKLLEVMIYVASRSSTGLPNPGYLERILDWAESWGFPEPYRNSLSGMLGKTL